MNNSPPAYTVSGGAGEMTEEKHRLMDEDSSSSLVHASSTSPGSTGEGGSSQSPGAVQRLGRLMKSKLTNSTHEDRARDRERKAEEERQAFQRHVDYRDTYLKAMRTGQPQLLRHDPDGTPVYLEPPPRNLGAGYGGPSGTGPGSYNVCSDSWPDNQPRDPNARYISTQMGSEPPKKDFGMAGPHTGGGLMYGGIGGMGGMGGM